MNKKWQIAKYICLDALAAFLALYFYLKVTNVVTLAVIIGCWILLYVVTLTYNRIYYKSRLKEFLKTAFVSFLGLLIIALMFYLKPSVIPYTNKIILNYILLHFAITAFFRFLITTRTAYRIHNRKIGFNTLLIGASQTALKFYNEVEQQKKSTGNKIVGYLKIKDVEDCFGNALTKLGGRNDLKYVIETNKIEEVIIALDDNEDSYTKEVIANLEGTGVVIKIIPDMYDILSGSVKMGAIYGTPLIEIYPDILSSWQQIFKRLFDVLLSLFFMILFLPVYIIIAILIKVTSKGDVIFKQVRIGKKGKEFYIYKFRTMYANAEKNGPELSSNTDERVTPIGRFLRKYRLDELPQFFNVLKGDMAIIGPRPERQYFIDKIMEIAPHYYHLTKVRPGITSWGQVKYGYAETVEQMVDRLKFDIIYIENVSFLLDMKILFYTVVTVLKGRGK